MSQHVKFFLLPPMRLLVVIITLLYLTVCSDKKKAVNIPFCLFNNT